MFFLQNSHWKGVVSSWQKLRESFAEKKWQEEQTATAWYLPSVQPSMHLWPFLSNTICAYLAHCSTMFLWCLEILKQTSNDLIPSPPPTTIYVTCFENHSRLPSFLLTLLSVSDYHLLLLPLDPVPSKWGWEPPDPDWISPQIILNAPSHYPRSWQSNKSRTCACTT